MINPEVIVIPFAFGFPTMAWIVRMTYRHKERMAELRRGSAGDPDVLGRLERLEQSVDSIAVEIERIGEGQRFVTRLLSGRQGEAPESIASPANPAT